MIRSCESCKLIAKGKDIIFLCPYNENHFGLDRNPECRRKLLKLNENNFKDINLIIFTNTKIKKIFDNEKIRKLIDAYNFFMKPYNKLLFKFKFRWNKEDIYNLIINPDKQLSTFTRYSDKIIQILSKNKFFSEIFEYRLMEYDWTNIFMRVFENDIDIDERLLNNYELMLHIKPMPTYTIKIFRTGTKFLYFVKIEKDKICEQGSIFSLLEDMSNGSNSLKRLIAAMLDPEVQEIYLDRENSWAYLDHANYGRCDTNIFLSSVDVEKFKTFIGIVTGEEISIGEPSLKTSLKTENVKLRISIDTYPVVEDSSFDIRKFGRKLLDLSEMIRKGGIPLSVASFLVLSLRNRLSIVICGEPNSGKTTLAHALAMHLPHVFRKVYLEDVDEVYSSVQDLPHSLFIKTSSIDVSEKYSKKSVEIIKLLHRSPDWIFLGELQTKEHSKAFFHALLAGLRGMVTCHSSSAMDLIKRWITQHEIPVENIAVLDIIVEMKREIEDNSIKRYVNSVYEVRAEKGLPELFKIYSI